MKFKSYQFSLASSGVQESFEEKNMSSDSSPYILFMDVIDRRDAEKAHKAEEMLSMTIQEVLADQIINEKNVDRAFQTAHQFLQKHFQCSFPISTLLMSPHEQGAIVFGAGDARLYSVSPGKSERVFSDPNNSTLSSHLSQEERRHNLKNAIGLKNKVKTHHQVIRLRDPQRFVFVTYGVYDQSSDHNLFTVGAQPHSTSKGAKVALSSLLPTEHLAKISTLTIQRLVDSSKARVAERANMQTRSSRKKRRYAALSLSLAVCTLIFAFTFLFLHDPQTPPETTERMMTVKDKAVHGATITPSIAMIQPISPEIIILKSQKDELQGKLKSQSEYIGELQHQLALATDGGDVRLIQDLNEKLDQAEVKLHETLWEQENFRIEAANLKQELQKTRESIAEIKAQFVENQSALTEEILALKKVIHEYEDQEQMLIQDRDHLEELVSKNLSENKEFQAHNTELSSRLQILEEELLSQNEDLRELEDLKVTNKTLEGVTSSLQLEVQNAKAARNEKEELYAQLNQSIKENNDQLESVKVRYTAHLEQLADQMEAAEEALESKEEEYETLNMSNQNLIGNIKGLEGEKDQLINKIEGLYDLQQQYLTESQKRIKAETLYAELSQDSQEQEKALMAFQDSRSTLVSRVEELRQQYLEETKKRLNLEQRYSNLNKNAEEQEKELLAFTESQGELLSRLEELNSEKGELLGEIKDSEGQEMELLASKAAQSDLVSRVDNLKREKRRLLEEKANYLESVRDFEEIKHQYASLQKDKKEISQQYSQSRLALKDLQEEHSQTREQLTKLKESLASSRTTITSKKPKTNTVTITQKKPTSTRIHLVAEGETLTGISYRYYGTAKKWKEIYEANTSAIPNKHNIRIGTALVIPE